MKLTDFIQTFDGVIKPDTCKMIIDQFEQNKHLAEKHNTELYKFDQLNLNKTEGLSQLAPIVAWQLTSIYDDYFKSLGLREYVQIESFEDIRIKKYEKGSGDEFRTHVDVSDKASSSRFCIAIMYLNDNDGLTTFPTLGVGVKPKAGRVVVFPPTWMYPHNGLTPTDNNKYIMMTCLHYR
jgi:hypothetical protein